MTATGATEALDALATAKGRAFWYFYRDGVNEIGMGVAMLGIVGISYMLHQQLAPSDTERTSLIWGFLSMAALLLDRPLRNFLRRRLTYPRIGYLSEKG